MYGHPIYGFHGHILGKSNFEKRRERAKRVRRAAVFLVAALLVVAVFKGVKQMQPWSQVKVTNEKSALFGRAGVVVATKGERSRVRLDAVAVSGEDDLPPLESDFEDVELQHLG